MDKKAYWHSDLHKVQVNNYEIVINFFHISHNLTWYSAIVHKFTRIYSVCSTYELTKQCMEICVENCVIDLKKNNLYLLFGKILQSQCAAEWRLTQFSAIQNPAQLRREILSSTKGVRQCTLSKKFPKYSGRC